jgi:uncharacterized protein YndB with AHSA1/START domain/effector-binding domain-containing protein
MNKIVGKLQIETVGDREIVMTRAFDAPRALVWRAWTEPALVKRWLGVFGGWTLAVCEIDLRVGGAYRYAWNDPSGKPAMGIRGTYREVVARERIVASEAFEPSWYEGEGIVTATFHDEGDKTVVRQLLRYASPEVREAVLKTPMAEGVSAGFETLENVLRGIGPDLVVEGHGTLDAPVIGAHAERLVAAIHIVVPSAQVREVMMPGLRELRAVLAAQGIAPSGPWLTHHLKMPSDVFDYEIAIPVDAAPKPTGRVVVSKLPACEVARTMYRGGYEGLGAAWGRFGKWIETTGKKTRGELWEVYVADGQSGGETRTELWRPIA